MIGVIGRMSGGKTYYAVECMLSWLLQGHIVASNVMLSCQGVTSALGVSCIFWKQLYYKLVDSPKFYHELSITAYDSWPCGSPRGSPDYDNRLCYIVLDEVSSLFDSLIHASDSSVQKVATWARHTRKRGQEVYLIMQFASELHKRLRNHVTGYVLCTNSSDIRVPVVGLKLPWFLRGLSIRTQLLPDGETPTSYNDWVRFRPEIYHAYNTAQIVVGPKELPLAPMRVRPDLSYRRYRQSYDLFLATLGFSTLFIIAGVCYAILSFT